MNFNYRKYILLALITIPVMDGIGQCDYTVTIEAPGLTNCQNEYLQAFTDAVSPAFQWYLEDQPIPGATEEFIFANLLGDYKVEVTDNLDCIELSEVYPIFQPAPQVTLSGVESFCQGSSGQIIADVGAGAHIEFWLDPIGNEFGNLMDTVEVFDPGAYIAYSLMDNTGCIGLDTFLTETFPNPLPIPQIYHSGDSLSTDQADSYQWYLDFIPLPGAIEQYLETTTAGIYQVLIGDLQGCKQLSEGYLLGDSILIMPPDIPFQFCHEPFNPEFTGWPSTPYENVTFSFRDEYLLGGETVFIDSEFKQTGYQLGNILPNTTAFDQNGNLWQTSIDPSKPTILDICTSWCSPCQAHANGLNAWLETLELQGTPVNYFMVLFEDGNGLLSDQSDAQVWANAFNLTVPVLWGTPSSELATSLNTVVVPTFVVLGIDQEIIGIQEGVNNANIEALLLDYATNHPLCVDSFELIRRQFQWHSGENSIPLDSIQEINFVASCSDGVLNGDETFIDCGGTDCPPCMDEDGDGIPDTEDNCPGIANPIQSDQNGNGLGDLCDPATSGLPGIGIGTDNPKDGIQLQQGNVYLKEENAGIILRSAEGTCWKLTVANDGATTTQLIDCPED